MSTDAENETEVQVVAGSNHVSPTKNSSSRAVSEKSGAALFDGSWRYGDVEH
jgi:hypothetical protein